MIKNLTFNKNIMNNKILSIILIAWIYTIGFTWLLSADDTNNDFISNTFKGLNGDRFINNLTSEEKKVFFETKQAERKSYNNVIDKLLAGETLTTEEEEYRVEIIEKKAERKIKQEARKVEMEEIKIILKKKRAWENLTEEEEAKLYEMKRKMRWKKWGKKWGKKGIYYRCEK